MSSALIKTHRSNAETYHGEALCKQKFHELLKELSLPKGLIRGDIEEMGHHQPSGFVWLKQKKTTHKFKSIGKTVSYDDELTMLVEKGRITKLTGVASKEVFVWISICEIYFDDLSSDKLAFKVPASLTATVRLWHLKTKMKRTTVSTEVFAKQTFLRENHRRKLGPNHCPKSVTSDFSFALKVGPFLAFLTVALQISITQIYRRAESFSPATIKSS